MQLRQLHYILAPMHLEPIFRKIHALITMQAGSTGNPAQTDTTLRARTQPCPRHGWCRQQQRFKKGAKAGPYVSMHYTCCAGMPGCCTTLHQHRLSCGLRHHIGVNINNPQHSQHSAAISHSNAEPVAATCAWHLPSIRIHPTLTDKAPISLHQCAWLRRWQLVCCALGGLSTGATLQQLRFRCCCNYAALKTSRRVAHSEVQQHYGICRCCAAAFGAEAERLYLLILTAGTAVSPCSCMCCIRD